MSNDLERRNPMALERPAFIKEGDTRGTENITRNDIKPPALKLAQAMSPEVKRSEPEFIKDLREGELFNSITKEIYGEGPIQVVFINFLGTRNIEFDPNDRKSVLDGNVPEGDPRTEFTFKKDPTGKDVRVKPKATKFKDYLIQVYIGARKAQLMTMSLKSTQLKKSLGLTTVFKGSAMPTFAFLFEVTTVPEHKGDNAWYGWKFVALGYVSEEQFNSAERLYNEMAGKNIELADESADEAPLKDDDIPF